MPCQEKIEILEETVEAYKASAGALRALRMQRVWEGGAGLAMLALA